MWLVGRTHNSSHFFGPIRKAPEVCAKLFDFERNGNCRPAQTVERFPRNLSIMLRIELPGLDGEPRCLSLLSKPFEESVCGSQATR